MIKPFAHSITVADPPASNPTRASGLQIVGMVEVEHERGVVVDIAPGCPQTDQLKPGDLVFYKRGCCAQIGDVKVVPEDYIIAFESSEA